MLKAKALDLGLRLNHQPLFGEAPDPGRPEVEPCYRPWEHLNVDQRGNASICCGGAASLGNIFEQDFFKVWNSAPFRAFRERVNSDNPPAACRKCTRGRENPRDVATHLTYLRSFSAEERQVRIEALLSRLGTGSGWPLPLSMPPGSPSRTDPAACCL